MLSSADARCREGFFWGGLSFMNGCAMRAWFAGDAALPADSTMQYAERACDDSRSFECIRPRSAGAPNCLPPGGARPPPVSILFASSCSIASPPLHHPAVPLLGSSLREETGLAPVTKS